MSIDEELGLTDVTLECQISGSSKELTDGCEKTARWIVRYPCSKGCKSSMKWYHACQSCRSYVQQAHMFCPGCSAPCKGIWDVL
jgi:hypothetical protein